MMFCVVVSLDALAAEAVIASSSRSLALMTEAVPGQNSTAHLSEGMPQWCITFIHVMCNSPPADVHTVHLDL
jgi:hypothetical protein